MKPTITNLHGAHGRGRTVASDRFLLLGALVWHVAFLCHPFATAFAGVIQVTTSLPDPAKQQRVQAALEKLKESPQDISAVETLLAVEPRIVETIGTNVSFSETDPVLNRALIWSQSLQPAEVLAACLEQGGNAAVHWALRQIVWRMGNGGFDKKNLARLIPSVEKALTKQRPTTQAQAVRTMLSCLPSEKRMVFLEGLLKGRPNEVMAAAVEAFANVRQANPDVESLTAKWLISSDDPLLLEACCSYWWMVKSQSAPVLKEAEIIAFERLAGHQHAGVRRYVALAVEAVATPERPRLVGTLLRLTHDKDPSVVYTATRSLRNADTPEVNLRLRELFAIDQPQDNRAAAIEVLGVFGKANLPLLLSAAKTDKVSLVRLHSIWALRRIGTSEAGKGLEAALQDPDEQIRSEAQAQLEWFRKEHTTSQ